MQYFIVDCGVKTPSPALCTLRSALCKRHAVIIDGALLIHHCVVPLPRRGRLTLHSALCAPHSALCTSRSALCTLHSALCTPHSALHPICTLHPSASSRLSCPQEAFMSEPSLRRTVARMPRDSRVAAKSFMPRLSAGLNPVSPTSLTGIRFT